MKKVYTAHTKLDKNAKTATKTVVTLDYTGLTLADIEPQASDSLIIALQGRWRRAKAVPATQEIKVKELIDSLRQRNGGPETVESLTAKVGSLSEAEKKALIERLTGKKAA